MAKRAVVLFNLGGPDGSQAVRPFLFNLFNDPAIIGAPMPIRWLLAQLISRRRAPVAREIYQQIGGKSPLLELTQAQARALEDALSSEEGETRVFICMRYWHPMSAQTAVDVKAFDPDEVVLLPLYPQYSTTTTGSSLADWHRAAAKAGLSAPTRSLCCYATEPGWIKAQADLTEQAMKALDTPYRVLFSAHGLPKKIVDAGDPYQWQVDQTAMAVVDALALDGLDWAVCYQSRVGPLQWIGPSTEDELARAALDGKAVVVVPIAFVSEHSETLVELDIEYRELALAKGVPDYIRVPAVGTHAQFIGGLADLISKAGLQAASPSGGRVCPQAFGRCGAET